MFIQDPKEAWIKDFFMNKIDGLLTNYEPGEPKMKPDVLKQTKEIEEQRARMSMQQQANAPIMISKDGGPPTPLSNQEILEIINSQKADIQKLVQQNQELQQIAINLQQQLIQSPPVQQIDILQGRIKELEDKIIFMQKKDNLENNSEKKSEEIDSENVKIEIIERSKSDPEVI